MLKNISATTLCLVAVLALSTVASAQERGSLALDLDPSEGVSGVWAQVTPGDMVKLSVSQLPAAKARPATIYIFISGIQVLGELDLETAVLLAQGKTDNEFSLGFQVPQMSGSAFSVQSLAVYEDGSYAISSVLTVIVDGPSTDPDLPADDTEKGEGAVNQDTKK